MAALRKTLLPLLLATTAGGCGGARTEADLGAAYARIQVEEARIEHAAAAPDCAEVAAAARDLCAIARDVEERDALVRCERAERRAAACAGPE